MSFNLLWGTGGKFLHLFFAKQKNKHIFVIRQKNNMQTQTQIIRQYSLNALLQGLGVYLMGGG
jgi:hypothetical protein